MTDAVCVSGSIEVSKHRILSMKRFKKRIMIHPSEILGIQF